MSEKTAKLERQKRFETNGEKKEVNQLIQKPSNSNSEITTEAAKQALEKEKNVRTEKCTKEMAAVMEKYNCTLEVQMILRANSIVPQVSIVSKP